MCRHREVNVARQKRRTIAGYIGSAKAGVAKVGIVKLGIARDRGGASKASDFPPRSGRCSGPKQKTNNPRT